MHRSKLLIPTVLAAAMAVISAPSSASLISGHNFYKDGVLYKSSTAQRSNSKRSKAAPQVVASLPVNCAPTAASSPAPSAKSSKAKSKSSKIASSKRLQNAYTYDHGTGSYVLTRVARTNTGSVPAAAAQSTTAPCLESPPVGVIGAPGLADGGIGPDALENILDEIFAAPTGLSRGCRRVWRECRSCRRVWRGMPGLPQRAGGVAAGPGGVA
jgi:hypothetical protein